MCFWNKPDGVFLKLDRWVCRVRFSGSAGEVVVAIIGVNGAAVRSSVSLEIESAVRDASLIWSFNALFSFAGD